MLSFHLSKDNAMLLRVLVQSPKGQYNTAVIKPPLKGHSATLHIAFINRHLKERYNINVTILHIKGQCNVTECDHP